MTTNTKHPSGMTKDTLLSVLFSLGIGFVTAVVLSLFVLLVSSQSYAEEAAIQKAEGNATTNLLSPTHSSAVQTGSTTR